MPQIAFVKYNIVILSAIYNNNNNNNNNDMYENVMMCVFVWLKTS